jgi:hypothetical protein
VTLADEWDDLQETLPDGWADAHVQLRIEEAGRLDRAAAILGPIQPTRAGADTLSFRVARDGSGPAPELVRRLLERLDRERIHGRLEVASTAAAPRRAAEEAELALAETWRRELATLPTDWSDLLGEIELLSSDYLERAALHLAPLNPRLEGGRLVLRFRCAKKFGYGASPGMVERCLERCDEDGIRGTVRILRALSDTRPVQTQGPVWQLSGRTV